MATKKVKTGTNAVAFTALVLLSLIAANLIGRRVYGRADLTADKIYTLSPASKALVRGLKDPVIVKAYLSKEVPPQVGQIQRHVRDLLDEYKAASGGKFQWESIDPESDPKKEEEAGKAGIRKLQLQQLSKDQVSVKGIYLGIAFAYGDKTDKLSEVGQIEGLEYEISSLLKRLTVKKRKMGFVSGQGELGEQQAQGIWRALSQNYDVQTVALSGQGAVTKIAGDIDALVVMGPKQPYGDPAKKAIDGFLMQGKAVAFLVDGMTLETPRGQMPQGMQMPRIARKNETSLESLLGSYGFKINDDIVMDAQNARGLVMVDGQPMLVNQPYFPIVDERGIGKHEITDKVHGIFFPLASSVEVTGTMKDLWDKGGKNGDAELVVLARSTTRSWQQTGFFMMDPTKPVKPADNAKSGPFAFAYAYRGALKSAYAGQAPAQGGMSTPEGDPERAPSESKGPVRLVVIGDSDFGSDEYLRGSRDIARLNGHFALNVMEWLVQDDALASVRGKGITERPLHVEEGTPTKVKVTNMLGLPLAFIAYGIVRWRMRRSRQAKVSQGASA
jgi:gliding-associated putative ABC transporter substrate-binding component GldG